MSNSRVPERFGLRAKMDYESIRKRNCLEVPVVRLTKDQPVPHVGGFREANLA